MMRYRVPAFAVLLALLVFIAFGDAIHNLVFEQYDDPIYLTERLQADPLGAETLQWIFTTTETGNWHPLALLSHAVDIALFGMDPAGHRIESLILHTLNALLVFWLALRLGRLWQERNRAPALTDNGLFLAAAATALFFAVHPMRVESVIWLAERKDLLYALFYLLAIHAYLRYVQLNGNPSAPRYYILSLGLFLLSCMSKPMAVTLPALLLLLDLYPLDRHARGIAWSRLLLEKLPFFAISLLFVVLTVYASSKGGGMFPLQVMSIEMRLLNASHSLVGYLSHLVLPLHLLPHYDFPEFVYQLSARAMVDVLAVVAMAVLALWIWRRYGNRALPMALLAYFVMLSPVLGLLQSGNQASADRFVYLPAIPLYLSLALFSVQGLQHHSRRLQLLAGVLFSLYLGWLTFKSHAYAKVWHDDNTLWSYTLAHEPNDHMASYALAFARYRLGDYASAAQLYHHTAVLRGGPIDVRYDECRALVMLKDYTRAYALCRQIASEDENYREIQYLLGIIRFDTGNYPLALEHFERSLQRQPENTAFRLSVAKTLLELERFEEARTQLAKVLEQEPGQAEALRLLEIAEQESGTAH